MKKLLTIAMAAALTFATAGQASAAPLETGGEYRGRFWFLSNYGGFAGPAYTETHDNNQDFWDQRLRLKMGWQVSEGVKVNARADVLENVWDDHCAHEPSTTKADRLRLGQRRDQPEPVDGRSRSVRWTSAGAPACTRRSTTATASSSPARPVTSGTASPGTSMASRPTTPRSLATTTRISAWVTGTVGGWNWGALVPVPLQQTTPGVETAAVGFDGFTKGGFGTVKLNAEVFYGFGTKDNAAKADIDNSALLAYVGAFMPLGPVNTRLRVLLRLRRRPDHATRTRARSSRITTSPFNSFILFNNFDLDGWNSVYSGRCRQGPEQRHRRQGLRSRQR